MGKWNQASDDGCCYNCDREVGYFNLVSANGWPCCEECAIEMDIERGYDD